MQNQIEALLKTGDADNIALARQLMRGHRKIAKAIKKKYAELTALANVKYVWELFSLTYLDLSWKGLTTLPDSIGDLVNLKTLELRCNDLKTLPDSMSKITNLRVLDISLNEFEVLPDFIGDLPNLQHLDLECAGAYFKPAWLDKIPYVRY